MACRFCASEALSRVVDLGFAPLSNAYLTDADLSLPETHYPLRVQVCNDCWLVQTEDYADYGDLFAADYAYFSSTSTSWLDHAKRYTDEITARLGLGTESFVVELASNDGYLLQNFVAAGIPCLGVEPTRDTAEAAIKLGVPVVQEFFGEDLGMRLAKERRRASLVIGNNVYAHVPDINDFTAGIAALLEPDGVVTLEFPHLLELLQHAQFDTIYHEHFSYLSLSVVQRIFSSNGMRIWDVEKIDTHGGSLRVYGCLESSQRATAQEVDMVLEAETDAGLFTMATYEDFAAKVLQIKDEFLDFLLRCKREHLKVCAYGAAAKGNTLLNYAGVRPDMLPFVCDAAKSKQGKYMPGSHIPILEPSAIREYRPDYVVVLPWNILAEVAASLDYIADWGGRIIVAVPELREA